MNNIVLSGGRIVDPANGLDTEADLFVSEGRIAGIGEAPSGFRAEQTLDVGGQIVCPGLIDLAARPREPGATHKATIASEARAAAAGGITTLCCPPDSQPVVDSTSVVELIRRREREAAGAKILPYGALTKGLAGEQLTEMAALKAAGCAAMADGGHVIRNSLVLRRAMEYAGSFKLPVLLTPKDPWLSEGGLIHEGHVATRLGLTGIPAAAETAALGRDLALVQQTGVRTHFGRLSTAAGANQIARAQQQGLPVTADVAALQLFLTEMDLWDFNTACQVDPPVRSDSDRAALRQAVANGQIAAICSDHQPHEPDAKDGPMGTSSPGASGLDSLLPLVLRLVDEGVLPLMDALARVTSNPAHILGLEAGSLAVGRVADICVFDPKAVWWFNAETMHSMGKNSPFLGWEFTGRVTHTLVDGRLVYRLSQQ
ncbi:dihydroorotase [Alkalilimnicola ehrlichii]|uniref:Dihydroorotase n=1 Tax=Alkalilimnicola ehrlichii TaxID=351052 RepID=A0A3E0X4A6_9GAMM|nr:dihydroorotase [Alkalilimnicola ehrlichii]RFA31203.1 dihydroorotase [Alkalilimnicola ehrlichii]RFA39515.1 dihydroorotase [Alkalilimnicola ehrlichii]